MVTRSEINILFELEACLREHEFTIREIEKLVDKHLVKHKARLLDTDINEIRSFKNLVSNKGIFQEKEDAIYLDNLIAGVANENHEAKKLLADEIIPVLEKLDSYLGTLFLVLRKIILAKQNHQDELNDRIQRVAQSYDGFISDIVRQITFSEEVLRKKEELIDS